MSGDLNPSLRASDADRDAVLDRLRSAHAEGRLTAEEFSERMDTALSARTMGDLAILTADLPASLPARARTGDEVDAGRPARRERGWADHGLRVAWGAWLTAVLVNLAIWGAVSVSNGDPVYFWPMWVAGPWGAVLLARTLRGRW